MPFKPVVPQPNFPELEKSLLKHWYETGVVEKYLTKNRHKKKRFSFLDGPITANNPMGVHHAWGRTYKDLWQRFFNMRQAAGRFTNGFDCQGLWVEVEVEKELGFKSKKDIEAYGVAKFVEKCKERVLKYSSIQTEQSKRLGYFMDWNNSYFTMSDQNNYAIWNFLKVVWQKGWLYKGHDSVPWCPRCETAISQHEMLTEDYKEIVHEAVYLKLPIKNHPHEYLLVWTTTPWTIPGNIAVAVDPKLDYQKVEHQGAHYWVAQSLVSKIFGPTATITETVKGLKLVGLKYTGPYDHLPAVVKIASHQLFHSVIAADPLIMPVNLEEGTGLIHTAVSAGIEDFKLGQKLSLPMVPLIADNADYLPQLGDLTGQNAKKNPRLILDYLQNHDFAFKIERYSHRYPNCWRCKTELVWKVADEWYIAMDQPDPNHPKKLTYRKQMQQVARKIKWLPHFGLSRELDWLRNMHDWLISKKNRYWGLALPIWACPTCDHFEVIGSQAELQSRAVSGWDKFAGHTPHKPYIDEVKINCPNCQKPISRIPDVGNPWLDAGIVPFSTLPPHWFPADFITESFPGQFKNWFYSLIAMSTALSGKPPFKTVLGFSTMLDSTGHPFHKSAGNAIEFTDGADRFGADVIRWVCASSQPENNILFGQKEADETRRRVHLILYNVYNFFVTYANLDRFSRPKSLSKLSLSTLDRWILARLNQITSQVTASLLKFDAYTATQSLEELISDLSLWYVRRSRDRVGPTTLDNADKLACHSTLYHVLTTLSQLLAPFIPFLSEEIYSNLHHGLSVHLSTWPKVKKLTPTELQLIEDMKQTRRIVEVGLSIRKSANLKVRQPLKSALITGPKLSVDLADLIAEELNVKKVEFNTSENQLKVELDQELDSQLIAEGEARELIRTIQQLRKDQGACLDQPIALTLPQLPPPHLLSHITRHTLANSVETGPNLSVKLL